MPRHLVRASLVALAGLLFAGATAASADTFCVNRSGCAAGAGHNFTTVQAAIDAAHANDPGYPADPIRDKILVGTGIYDGAVDNGVDNPVDVFGSGRWRPSLPPMLQGTLIKRADGNSLTTVTMSFSYGGVAASTLHDVTVRVSTGSNNTGVHTDGDLDNVEVSADANLTNGVGVDVEGNGPTLYRDGRVSLPGTAIGVRMHNAITERSIVQASTGFQGEGGTIRRSTIQANVGATGDFTRVEDCVMQIYGPGAIAFKALGIGDNASESVTARNDTVIGDGGSGSIAALAHAQATSGASNSAEVEIRSSIIRGFAKNFDRSGGAAGPDAAPADILVAYSDYDPNLPKTDAGGQGSINETTPGGNTSADPGFRSTSSPPDFHLLPTSPLIDRGDPASPDPAVFSPPESTVDFDGRARKVDGDGNGKARVDVGAFEFQQTRPTIASATATPKTPSTGQSVSFKGVASDSDGEPVTFHWKFGNGAPATGPTVSHRYTNGGKKVAVLTVVDSRGLSSVRRITLHVRGPAIKIKTPVDGARYKQGKKVIAHFSCSEPFGSARVTSCKGSVADGKAIGTATTGTHTFTVKARDKAGRRAKKTIHYTVTKK